MGVGPQCVSSFSSGHVCFSRSVFDDAQLAGVGPLMLNLQVGLISRGDCAVRRWPCPTSRARLTHRIQRGTERNSPVIPTHTEASIPIFSRGVSLVPSVQLRHGTKSSPIQVHGGFAWLGEITARNGTQRGAKPNSPAVSTHPTTVTHGHPIDDRLELSTAHPSIHLGRGGGLVSSVQLRRGTKPSHIQVHARIHIDDRFELTPAYSSARVDASSCPSNFDVAPNLLRSRFMTTSPASVSSRIRHRRVPPARVHGLVQSDLTNGIDKRTKGDVPSACFGRFDSRPEAAV